MGRNKKRNRLNRRKTGKKQKRIMIILAVVLVLLLIWAAIVYHESSKEKKAEKTKEEQQITFPYELEDGKLILESVFPYTGTNLDCNEEEGEDIGAIQLTNMSDETLETADITVMMSDKSELKFRVEELPSGESVLAFDIENNVLDQSAEVIDITVETSYSSKTSLEEESFSMTIEEDQIQLTNVTQDDLKNISVKYHCRLNDMYFGGKCYESLVETLKAGETTVIDASECYLGEAAVISITY